CLAAAVPHLAAMLIATEGDSDVPDIPTPRSYAEAITGPYSSQWQTAMEAEMASSKFTGAYGTQWSLWRPVYGLRQAPSEQHDTVRMTLVALGFAPSISEPSMFLRTDSTLLPFYILVCVDDLVFATADSESLVLVKAGLQKRHTSVNLVELQTHLGLHITRDRAARTITLTQSHMVQYVLQRFGFHFSTAYSTPLPTGHMLSAPPLDKSVEPTGQYPDFASCS
ncbi:unnamed protein product, partial [Closterium sp. NIES-53]